MTGTQDPLYHELSYRTHFSSNHSWDIQLENETSQEIIAKGRTTGAFRCLNCFERVVAPHGARTFKCSHCGFEWRLAWLAPDLPRIRGPVWDINRQLSEESTAKEEHDKK